MLELLIDIDTQIFLFLNVLNTPWLDKAMYLITNKYVWIPLYIFIIILILWRFRLRGITGIVLIIIAIGLSDYITSGIMKPFFERLRPCHNPEISYMVHLVSNRDGEVKPVLSGTSLAGAMRARALRIAKTVRSDADAEKLVDAVFGPSKIPELNQRRQGQLRAGGVAARIGDQPRLADVAPVDLDQAVDRLLL